MPTAPTEYNVPAFSLPTGGRSWNPANSAELQDAFDGCTEGDVIYLDADVTYTGPFEVRAVNAGQGAQSGKWVYVVTDEYASLPAEGTRVAVTDNTFMATVRSTAVNQYALNIHRGATKLRFVGIEITTTYDQRTGIQYALCRVGNTGTGICADIVFDRCYCHGTTTGNNRDGWLIKWVTGGGIVDSRIDEIHGVNTESHGIQITAGRQWIVDNCWIEAAGINMFIGDNDVPRTPEDIIVRNCNIYKPLRWDSDGPLYEGIHWQVKNTFEIKVCNRMLCEYNAIEHSWVDAQTGYAWLIKAEGDVDDRNGAGGTWDVMIRNNIARDVARIVALSNLNHPMGRCTFENNLVYQHSSNTLRAIGVAGDNNIRMGPITIQHNTMLSDNSGGAMNLGVGGFENAIENLIFKSNIIMKGTYGIKGDDVGAGLATIQFYCANYDFDHNLILEQTNPYDTDANCTNWHVEDSVDDVGFVDTSFNDVPADFALTAESDYYEADANGDDIGCNTTQLTGVMPIGD